MLVVGVVVIPAEVVCGAPFRPDAVAARIDDGVTTGTVPTAAAVGDCDIAMGTPSVFEGIETGTETPTF